MNAIISVLRLLAIAVWLAAAVFLGTEDPAKHDALRVAAAVVVGLPGALTLAGSLGRLLGTPSPRTRERVKHILQAGLVTIYREGFYTDDLTLVSLHVWVVPLWYRTLVPYKVRKRIKVEGDKRRWPARMRPALTRLALHRFEHHEPAGIVFRKGVGLVGRCIELNQPGVAHTVRLDSKAIKAALAKDEAGWRKEKETIHQNLKIRDARRIAATYSQAAAIVIRETSGEAIGCVTLELPPGTTVHFSGGKNNKLLKQLIVTAGLVQNQLQRRGSKEH